MIFHGCTRCQGTLYMDGEAQWTCLNCGKVGYDFQPIAIPENPRVNSGQRDRKPHVPRVPWEPMPSVQNLRRRYQLPRSE